MWTQDTKNDGRGRLAKPSCGRRMKFEDQLRRYAASIGVRTWTTLAGDRDAWSSNTAPFVAWAVT